LGIAILEDQAAIGFGLNFFFRITEIAGTLFCGEVFIFALSGWKKKNGENLYGAWV